MRKRRALIILLGGIALTFVAVWQVNRNHDNEPSYQGQTLTEWLELYNSTEPPEDYWERRKRATVAIRSIGTNALPYLLASLRYEPKGWQKSIETQINRQKLPSYLFLLTGYDRVINRAFAAESGFEILGTIASPAIPDLIKLIGDPNARFAGGFAMDSLVYLGESAVVPISEILTNASSPQHRRAPSAIFKMRYLGTNAAPLVPLLARYTMDPDRTMAEGAIQALGQLHLLPQVSIPALTNSLSHSDSTIRAWAIRSLGNFEAAARPAIPALLPLRDDSDYLVRELATQALKKIAPEVQANTAEE